MVVVREEGDEGPATGMAEWEAEGEWGCEVMSMADEFELGECGRETSMNWLDL